MAPPPVNTKKKRPVGAGLSLDKFASLGVSKFDKRKKLERLQKEKLIQKSKLSKLKKKLEAQGVLSGRQVKDAVAELDALEGTGSEDAADEPSNAVARVTSHKQAGPRLDPEQHGRDGLPATDPGAPTRRGGQDRTSKDAIPRIASTRLKHGDQSGEHDSAPQDTAHPGKKRVATDQEPQRPGRTKQQKHGPGPGGSARGDGSRDGGANNDGGSRGGRVGAGAEARGRKDGARGADEAAAADEDEEQAGAGPHKREGKKLSRLQRLALKVAEEKAEKQRAKEAAMKERQERQQRVAAVEKARKEQKHLYFKRTSSGQPLMRYRMEKLLDKIKQGA